MFEVDPDTGFPKLPAGRVWRVKEVEAVSLYDYTMIRLQLVQTDAERTKKRLFKKPVTIVEDLVLSEEKWIKREFVREEDPRATLKAAAFNIMRRRKAIDLTDQLIGDYPPKNLNTEYGN